MKSSYRIPSCELEMFAGFCKCQTAVSVFPIQCFNAIPAVLPQAYVSCRNISIIVKLSTWNSIRDGTVIHRLSYDFHDANITITKAKLITSCADVTGLLS